MYRIFVDNKFCIHMLSLTFIKRFFLCLTIIISANNLSGQTDFIIVNNITFKGNKKTTDRVVKYEMAIEKGDTLTLKALNKIIILEEKRILNTRLFTFVKINIKNWDQISNRLDLEVNLQENWYIYPAPIFELADRSFNVWWKEQKRSLKRVNFGARIDHLNLTGNKDRLKLKLQFGYVRKYELKYAFPYLKGGWGLSTNIVYSEQKEIGYITRGNKTLFEQLEDERILLKRFRASTSLSKRIGLRFFQVIRFSYHQNEVDDFVVQNLNSNYFLSNNTNLKFLQLEYDADYDKRVFTIYPEGGYRLKVNIKKDGFGFESEYNNLSIVGSIEKYWKLWEALIIETRLRGKTNLIRDRIPFSNNTGLGYGGNIITGYELYVIDGTDYIIHKNALKLSILDITKRWDKMILRQYKKVSIKAWLRWNIDYGYVNERHSTEGNLLNNQWLFGYGPALDVLLYNTFSFQLEYSFNEIGDKAFFIKSRLNF
ncbi:MAG TPA: hypothetical protein DGP89_00270 [Saprospirales bacterium]|nr:hypothetical protein [Saprospirales bacterium]